MNAVITIVGKDAVGIVAKVSGACADFNANVMEVNQSIMGGSIFTMVMLVDISEMKGSIAELSKAIEGVLEGQDLMSHVMHGDIFKAMHRI